MAQLNVPCEGKDINVFQFRLCKGGRHELSALEHSDVRLWVIKADHECCPLPQRKGSKPLQPQFGGRVLPGFEEGKEDRKPGYVRTGCCCRHLGYGVARLGVIFLGLEGLVKGWGWRKG